MLYFIVYFKTDSQYIVTNEDYMEFSGEAHKFTLNDWKSVDHETDITGQCLYDNSVFECTVVFVTVNEAGAQFLLNKIRRVVLEKKSSFRTIRESFPFTGDSHRTRVRPLSHILTSGDEENVVYTNRQNNCDTDCFPPLPQMTRNSSNIRDSASSDDPASQTTSISDTAKAAINLPTPTYSINPTTSTYSVNPPTPSINPMTPTYSTNPTTPSINPTTSIYSVNPTSPTKTVSVNTPVASCAHSTPIQSSTPTATSQCSRSLAKSSTKWRIAKLTEANKTLEHRIEDLENRISRLEKTVSGTISVNVSHSQLVGLEDLSEAKEKIKDPLYRQSLVSRC